MQLVINTFGASLRKHSEQFLVQAGPNKLAVSAHKVRSILITTGVLVSTDALELAIAHNIDVLLLDSHGEPQGRFWQTRMGSTAAIRRRQLEVAAAPEGLGLVREWVLVKLRHQMEFLEELKSRRPGCDELFDTALTGLRGGQERVSALRGTMDEHRSTLLGLEGSAGRGYWAVLSKLMPEAYRFDGRSRQPAADAFNAMLNYGYGVLYGLVERACIIAGLDPCLGFFHTDNYGKPALVFDMIEAFRILADRTVVLLFTGRRVQKSWVEPVPGGVTMTKDGKAGLLTALNERMERTVRYPVRNKSGKCRNIKQRDVIQFEAHSLANQLLGRDDLPRIVQTRELWSEEGSAVAEEEEEVSAELTEPTDFPERQEDGT